MLVIECMFLALIKGLGIAEKILFETELSCL